MNILLPAMDTSPAGQNAFSAIVARPGPEGTEMLVLIVPEVIPPADRGFPAFSILASIVATSPSGGVSRARQTLAAATKLLPDAMTMLFELQNEQNVNDVIVGQAVKWRVDLIVPDSHALRRLARFCLAAFHGFPAPRFRDCLK